MPFDQRVLIVNPSEVDPFHDAENGTKATSLTRDKAIPPEVKESAIKSCDSGICWYELKGDDVDVDHVQKVGLDALSYQKYYFVLTTVFAASQDELR